MPSDSLNRSIRLSYSGANSANHSGSSNKFYYIDIFHLSDGRARVDLTYGKVGTAGTTTRKYFSSHLDAVLFAREKKNSKTKHSKTPYKIDYDTLYSGKEDKKTEKKSKKPKETIEDALISILEDD